MIQGATQATESATNTMHKYNQYGQSPVTSDIDDINCNVGVFNVIWVYK